MIHRTPFGIVHVRHLSRSCQVLTHIVNQLSDIGRDVVPLSGEIVHVVLVFLRKAEVVSRNRRVSCKRLVDRFAKVKKFQSTNNSSDGLRLTRLNIYDCSSFESYRSNWGLAPSSILKAYP